MRRPPPRSTLCPYTTLFRSCVAWSNCLCRAAATPARAIRADLARRLCGGNTEDGAVKKGPNELQRSEEDTDELQSRQYLVCRLLLGKKHHPVGHIGLDRTYR